MTFRRGAVNTVAMIALVMLALVPMSAAYGDAAFWVAAAGGATIGTAIAVGGAVWRWHPLTVAAVAVVAYFLFGAVFVFRDVAIAGVIPTLEVLTSLALGVVLSWKQALTLQTPFVGFDQVLVVPFLTAIVASTASVSVALRTRRFAALALTAPALLLILSIAFSTYRGLEPGLVGAGWGAVALAWTVWRLRVARSDAAAEVDVSDARPDRMRPVTAAVGVVAVIAIAVVTGGAAATAVAVSDRDVLRDRIVPPLDLHDYASPLTSYRKYMRDGEASTLLTVSGLPSGVPVRLATLDFYDGVVYQVSGSGGAGAGVFSRVGREIDVEETGEPATVGVQIGDLSGVWVPTVGYASRIAFTRAADADLEGSLHYNTATGTAIATAGIADGDSYELDVVVPTAPSAEELADAEIASISTPAPGAVPDEAMALLQEITDGAVSAAEQVTAIEAYFQTEGFYSSGLEGQVVSRSGHNLEREAALLAGSQMIGDGEQYAVAMALMLGQLGIPVRVVMGFVPEEPAETVAITGDDLQAWVEVPFQDIGWVRFSPTPSKDRVPQEEVPEEQQRPRAQVAQPPQTPQEPAELPPDAPLQDAQTQEESTDLSWLWSALRIAGVSLLVLLALFGPSIGFAIARARRRGRRRRAGTAVQRVDGGWAELVDAATDVGAPAMAGATRREHARALDERYPGTTVAALAERADATVFGAGDGTDSDADRYWDEVRDAERAFRAAVPWHRRLRASLLPASIVMAIRVRRVRGNRRSGGKRTS